MPSFVPRVNNFFSFAKVFRGDRQSFFSRREERLCSPLLSKSTTFFRFVKLSFHRGAKSFSSIARSVYAPLRFRSQPLFCILANFAATQCVNPVTREMHSKQTPHPCQHKNHFFANIRAKAHSEPVLAFFHCAIPPTDTALRQRNIAIRNHFPTLSSVFPRHTVRAYPRQPHLYDSYSLFIDTRPNISLVGEICLTSIHSIPIFRQTTK